MAHRVGVSTREHSVSDICHDIILVASLNAGKKDFAKNRFFIANSLIAFESKLFAIS